MAKHKNADADTPGSAPSTGVAPAVAPAVAPHDVPARGAWLDRGNDELADIGDADPAPWLAMGFKLCSAKESARHESARDAIIAAQLK